MHTLTRRTHARVAALVALPLLFAAAPAMAGGPFPFGVERKTLDNGLKVLVVPVDTPGLVAVYTVVRTGSRNEVEKGKSGFAHFFEHMMFRGTKRFSSEAYNDELKRMGADSNAWTWHDQTVYHILAGKASLPRILELEADRFQNLHYSEAAFQKESRAVLGEYNKSASNPLQKMDERLYDLAFDKHTYEHTTIGFLKDIEAMPKQFAYSRKFFDRYYRPDNVVLLVVGDVKGEDVFPLADKLYGGWKKGPKRPKVPAEPAQKKERREALTWPSPTQARLLMGYKVPAFSTESVDHAALSVLQQVVFAERSPLYRRLVIDEQKALSLRADNPQKVDPPLFEILATLRDPADLEYVEKVITEELARVATEGVDAKTLSETKSHMRYAFAKELATADDVASQAAWYVSLTGDTDAIDAYYAQVAKVTPEDVKRVAATYLVPKRRTVITLVGKEAK